MADRRIAGYTLGKVHCSGNRLLLKQLFYPAMFPEVTHFELHDGLTGDRKAEMPRFDDACVDRSNGHLEDPFALNLPKRVPTLGPLQHRVPLKFFP